MSEIQKADPKARRHAILVLGCSALIGAAAILAFLSYRPALEGWVTEDPAQMRGRLRLVLGALGVLLTAPLAGLAVYLWRLGSRVVQARRFPPPGMAVIRDTPVLWDRDAERRGRWMQLFAALLAVAACMMLGLLWLIAGLVGA
jgi:hypothetical protein